MECRSTLEMESCMSPQSNKTLQLTLDPAAAAAIAFAAPASSAAELGRYVF